MIILRVCQLSLTPLLRAAPTRTLFMVKPCGPRLLIRTFANDSRNSFQNRLAKRRSLRDVAMEPAGDTAFNIGRGALAGASALGLGALCYYGLGLSKQAGAADKYSFWPEYVKQRIHTTYMYFGGALAITAASAVAALHSPLIMNLVTKNSFLAIAGTMAAMIGSGMVVRGMPYKEGFGAKQIAWIVHSGIIGCVVAPVCLLGGPAITKAAWYTLGVVGGLTTIAMCAPSEKFLHMSGPLAIGLGTVFVASIGTMFLPPTSVLGAGLYSISLYGGLLLFSVFLLHDTQRIIQAAESHPPYSHQPFDPVNASMSIYMDAINIFIRMAIILSGGGGGRRK